VSFGVLHDVGAVDLLEDPGLRRAVVRTWAAALAASPYDRLQDVPQNPRLPTRGLLDHVNEVNRRVLALLATAAEEFGVEADPEVTLAAAILHDVDKPILYRWDGSRFSLAPGRAASDHGLVGADLAGECGVPARVSELVRFHSPFAPPSPGFTPEATVLHYADLVASDLAALRAGLEPLHERVRWVRREEARDG